MAGSSLIWLFGNIMQCTIGLDLSSTGASVNNATLAITLTDPQNNVVYGVNNLSLPFIAGEVYQVNLPANTPVTIGIKYTLTLSSNCGVSVSYPVTVQARTS